jgi:hypothetical protein
MRKVIVGLIMVGLLVSAGQVGAAPALPNGSGDTLGLIASGAIQPFWALGANVTMIEITSPVGNNPRLEVVFFDANCVRDFSFPFDLTPNDVLIFSVDDYIPAPAYNGLAVIAATIDNVNLRPLLNPVHVRGQWINIALDFIREVTPITL